MNIKYTLAKMVLVLWILWHCSSCKVQSEPVPNTLTPLATISPTSSRLFRTPSTQLSKIPSIPIETAIPTILTETPTSTMPEILGAAAFPILPFASTNVSNSLPNDIEPYIYMIGFTSPNIANEHTAQKIWRYSLEDGSFDIIASWPTSEAPTLADSVPEDHKADMAAKMGVTQKELGNLTEIVCPLHISASPDGRYLALNTISWVHGLDYEAQIKSAVLLLNLPTGKMQELWSSWENIGFAQFHWSPNGSKLAFQLTISYETFSVYVYEPNAAKLTYLSELTAIARNKNGGYEAITWDEESENLLLSLAEYPAPFHFLVYEMTNGNVKTMEIPNVISVWVNNVFESRTSGLWIVHRESRQRVWLSRPDIKTGTLHPIIEVQNLPLAMPASSQSNAGGTLIAYENWASSDERSLRVLDLINDEDFVVLDAAPYEWEWSSLANIILVRFGKTEIIGAKIGLVDVENKVVITLPEPPNMDEYESVISPVW